MPRSQAGFLLRGEWAALTVIIDVSSPKGPRLVLQRGFTIEEREQRVPHLVECSHQQSDVRTSEAESIVLDETQDAKADHCLEQDTERVKRGISESGFPPTERLFSDPRYGESTGSRLCVSEEALGDHIREKFVARIQLERPHEPITN